MNRKGDSGSGSGSGLDELAGLLIGLAGVVCVWLGAMIAGSVAGAVNIDGELRMYVAGTGESTALFGSDWSTVDTQQRLDELGVSRVVLLVHGLDEPGGVWDDAAPAIAAAGRGLVDSDRFGEGFRVARFDYPNDQAVRTSAAGLQKAIEILGEMGVERVDLVVHSMGGLVSREAMTNPDLGRSDGDGYIGGVRIGRLIMVGTPNEGSAWAKLRGVADLRERVQRWVASGSMELSILTDVAGDGDGQAGVDLLPGSDFLEALNARAMPESVVVTCVVGRVVDPALLNGANQTAIETAEAFGDGVVSVESAVLDGCADVVVLVANHRSLLRTVEIEEGWRAMVGAEDAPVPEGIGVILDRLKTPID